MDAEPRDFVLSYSALILKKYFAASACGKYLVNDDGVAVRPNEDDARVKSNTLGATLSQKAADVAMVNLAGDLSAYFSRSLWPRQSTRRSFGQLVRVLGVLEFRT